LTDVPKHLLHECGNHHQEIFSADRKHKIDAFLKRSRHYGFTTSSYKMQSLIHSAMTCLIQAALLLQRGRAMLCVSQ